MSLFQTSVLKKYLKQQDKSPIEKAYKKFSKYFQDPKIQENIRASKEEEYQGIFLTELFVNILGYTMKPNVGFNLVAEKKNEKNSKKADGAILNGDNVLGVIELKGTDTKDLEKVRQQAFDYKLNHKGCIYVITSNFEKLRFYINDAIEFEEFDLFNINEQRFELLYLCLSKESALNELPLKIKEASLQEEEMITKKFYADYSMFKRELFRDLVKNNMKNEVFRQELTLEDAERGTKNIKMKLFKKSQKLIDRFLFIFFAEDRGLLPPNSAKQIIDKWKSDVDFGDDRPLYGMFKTYFNFLDIGRKGTQSRAEIFAYNGGLFKPDTVLDSLVISNELLHKHTDALQAYDFESQVDVNILGHIFENSLNEIESINAEIEGADFDKQKTKRKKDGVFYTPKYITKYMVENTIGKLCNDKKIELGIDSIDGSKNYILKDRRTIKKTVIVETGKGLVKTIEKSKTNLSVEGEKIVAEIESYRLWLLQITILDPACGSGAFLNQALNYLITEHKLIDELLSLVQKTSMVIPDIENTVLENNIFGVDLNEESVEIAKLSLWLRTAQPRRKLSSLNNNVKCGNSLINNKSIAGDKAFNWENEFAHVFDKGGFDVVIGNPPYVPAEYISNEDKIFLEKTYDSAFGRLNLYPIFYEKGIKILKPKGVLSYITPYTILKNKYYKEARKFILNNTSISTLIDFKGVLVFEDAAVDSIILTLKKEKKSQSKYLQISNVKNFQNQQYLTSYISQDEIHKSEDLSFNVSQFEKIISKISKDCIPLKYIVNFNQGIITGGNSKYLTAEKNDLTKKVITGSDFNRYIFQDSGTYITYDTKNLHRPRKKEIFEVNEKILLRQTSSYPICMIDTEKYYTLDTVHNGLMINQAYESKYILSLLNSKLLRFLYENSINETGKVFAQVKIIYIDPLPIKSVSLEKQNVFIHKVDNLLEKSKIFSNYTNKFTRYTKSSFSINVLSRKLQKWYELHFTDFISEVNKIIKKSGGNKLSKMDEMDWMEVFESKKAEAQQLKSEIDKIDSEIDQMVYDLYDLTADEIKIVEESA